MPYDNQGRWYLSQEANDVLASTRNDEKALIAAFIKSGDLEEGEFLSDLWQHGDDAWEATDWESDSSLQGGTPNFRRYDVLKEYQKKYGTSIPSDIDSRNAFGMGLERESKGNDLKFKNVNSLGIMTMLMGGKDYEVDYAHYNKNLYYRAAIAEMKSDFPDMRADFTSVTQIRKAQAILRKDGFVPDIEWARQHATPYTNGEIEALEDFKKHNLTRHFDKEYKITTYLDPKDSRALSLKLYDARAAGNYTRMEEPAAPEWLNIVGGTAPKEEYDSEGQRIIAEGDIRSLYQRYLGRDYNKLVDTNVDPNDPSKAIDEDAIGKDEIAYWEASALQNNWTYDKIVEMLRTSTEGLQNKDRGRVFYNPNQGKEAAIRAKLVDDPTETNAITPPSLTIRKLKGDVQKPSKQAGHSSNLDGFNVKKPVTGEAL